ncbi:E3 ubiquitin-protein ligase RNF12-B-like [Hylaeus anthracinus]|uniref:E3 ubiquitin-protein ligase RNF12-B-like n=1 Tax=Hylaeus anthracinus TaxID=313031 RepID=UPI0023BA067E|nr:E3 ubiquitin-protein ligase RNF12-B-like [Hylaeus anthracinus]
MKASFALLLLSVAMALAIPVANIEKKSLSDVDQEEINLEEVGDDTDREKKAILCLDIRTGEQGPCDQQSQPAPQVQTFNFQSAPQPMQAMSVIPGPQLISQQSYVIPQQVVPSVNTLQIVQQPQPCAPQATVKIIDSKPQEEPEPPKVPERIEIPKVDVITQPPVPRELPDYVEPPCNDEMVVVPSKPLVVMPEPTMVKIHHCPHHSQQDPSSHASQCTCKQQAMTAVRAGHMLPSHLHFMAMRSNPMGNFYETQIADMQ